jgi:hypothetical protein
LIICSPSESDGQSESHHAHRRQFPSVEYETSIKTSIQSAMEALLEPQFPKWPSPFVKCSARSIQRIRCPPTAPQAPRNRIRANADNRKASRSSLFERSSFTGKMEFQARDNSACLSELSLIHRARRRLLHCCYNPIMALLHRFVILPLNQRVVMFAHDTHCQVARLHLLRRSRAMAEEFKSK